MNMIDYRNNIKLPLVTVYITNYNYGSYIKQAIESVINQIFTEFELIIIDDGSTDNSREIIEKYRSHPKIKIIYQKNIGLNASNNVAIKNARGKYIIRLDADDFFEPAALIIMSSILETDDQLGLVFPDYYYVDSEGNRTGQERRHHFDDEVTLYDQPAHGACTMVRLDFLKNLGGYDEEFNCQDGYELWLKFITFYKVTNISRPLFSYRRHDYNSTINQISILNTRKRIKAKFAIKYFKIPRTLAVIPVRRKMIKKNNWPLFKYNSQSVLELKVNTCLKTNNINHVVIVSDDKEILEYASILWDKSEQITIVERPKYFAAKRVGLEKTMRFVLDEMDKRDCKFDIIMSLSIDYPFLEASTIDDVVNTITIFNAESSITTIADNSTFYQHSGSSLKRILNHDIYTKYEREALYKHTGGIMASTVESFYQLGGIGKGKIAHVLLDSQNAFGVFSDFEFDVYTSFSQKLKKL